MSQIVDGVRFSSPADQSAWPELVSPGANILSLANADLRLDAGRGLVFPGDAPLSISGALVVSTGSPPQERLRVTADGNVGIGTAAPAARLAVEGDLRVSGKL